MKKIFSGVLVLTLLVPGFASAASFGGGETYTLSQSEVINDNFYAGGGNVSISGKINGDLVAGGGDVTVSGPVSGDILIGAGNVSLLAPVGGDVRVASGDVIISGNVGGDLVVAAGNVHIPAGTVISGDLVLLSGAVRLGGDILGEVKGFAGSVILSGSVLGDVKVDIDELVLEESARLAGDLSYTSHQELTQKEGAVVSGEIMYNAPEVLPEVKAGAVAAFFSGVAATLAIMALAGMILLAILFKFIVPRFTEDYVKVTMDNFWMNVLLGLAVLVVTPVVIIILFATLVGFPTAIMLMLAYALVVFVGKVFAGITIGSFAFSMMSKERTLVVTIWSVIAGMLITYLLAFIPIFGGIVGLLFFFAALGGAAMLANGVLKRLRS